MPRPVQPQAPPREAFAVHRAAVADGLNLAYLREGVGGYPLLLVHGYPETKRIWWRNVKPLADAANRQAIKRENDDRKWVVLDISPSRAGDLNYGPQLYRATQSEKMGPLFFRIL